MEINEKDVEIDPSEETEENQYGESQIEDDTPLTPSETGSGIPFADQPTNPEENPPPSVAAEQNAGPTPNTLGGAPEKGPEVTPPDPRPYSDEDVTVHDTFEGREVSSPVVEPKQPWTKETSRSGRKPGRKPGRKTGKKEKPEVIVTQDAVTPQRMDVSWVFFVQATQIFNKAETFIRARDVHSSRYKNLVMWLENDLLWIRVTDVNKNEFSHQCVPISNVASFTPS